MSYSNNACTHNVKNGAKLKKNKIKLLCASVGKFTLGMEALKTISKTSHTTPPPV